MALGLPGCLDALHGGPQPTGFLQLAPRLQSGSSAPLLLDLFVKLDAEVRGSHLRIRGEIGSLDPEAQVPHPDCTDCYVFEVGPLRRLALKDARVDLAAATLPIPKATPAWRGELAEGEIGLFEKDVMVPGPGYWRVEAELRAEWADIENLSFDAGSQADPYRESDAFFVLHDETRLEVRRDEAWCPSGYAFDPADRSCAPSDGGAATPLGTE